MSVVVVTPAEPVITLEEAKAHLRVDTSDDDVLIEAYVAAATESLAGPEGWLGRSLGVTTLELRLSAFPCAARRNIAASGVLTLPLGPVTEIVSVDYVDGDGADQGVLPADFLLTSGDMLMPGYGLSWPVARLHGDTVKIRYKAGYPDGVPAPIRAAILLMTGDLYANRETAAVGLTAAAIPMTTTVSRLLAPYRNVRV